MEPKTIDPAQKAELERFIQNRKRELAACKERIKELRRQLDEELQGRQTLEAIIGSD